jgi:hypothetical protein
MKKSFYLIAILCLLGNGAYALDVTMLSDLTKGNAAIHSTSVEAYQTALKAEVGSKTLRPLRSLSQIQGDKALLFGSTDGASHQRLKDLKDEENEYIRKAESYAGFQRAIAYAYRHRLPFDGIIKVFVEEFYQD